MYIKDTPVYVNVRPKPKPIFPTVKIPPFDVIRHFLAKLALLKNHFLGKLNFLGGIFGHGSKQLFKPKPGYRPRPSYRPRPNQPTRRPTPSRPTTTRRTTRRPTYSTPSDSYGAPWGDLLPPLTTTRRPRTTTKPPQSTFFPWPPRPPSSGYGAPWDDLITPSTTRAPSSTPPPRQTTSYPSLTLPPYPPLDSYGAPLGPLPPPGSACDLRQPDQTSVPRESETISPDLDDTNSLETWLTRLLPSEQPTTSSRNSHCGGWREDTEEGGGPPRQLRGAPCHLGDRPSTHYLGAIRHGGNVGNRSYELISRITRSGSCASCETVGQLRSPTGTRCWDQKQPKGPRWHADS